ncbi:MAG: TetR/AcrR family transcriptional regulator [Gemmatimonadaceae bacterium]|nr:TetR/AcrR family transcriptional regulator [Gemmatimonadaceae bacterium]
MRPRSQRLEYGIKDLRTKAIDAAYEQFGSTGALSMRKVGAALGVSAPALYHHFADKQELLYAVADRAFSEFDRRLRSSDSRDPHRVIHGILGQYRRFAADHPSLFGLMFVEPRPSARCFPRDFAAHRLAVFNQLWNAVAECVSDSADGTSDDSLYAAHDLWALAHGQILLWRAGRFENDRTFEETFDRSIERFITAL